MRPKVDKPFGTKKTGFETVPMPLAGGVNLSQTFFDGSSLVSSDGGSLRIPSALREENSPFTFPSSKSLPNHRKTRSGFCGGDAATISMECDGSSQA